MRGPHREKEGHPWRVSNIEEGQRDRESNDSKAGGAAQEDQLYTVVLDAMEKLAAGGMRQGEADRL